MKSDKMRAAFEAWSTSRAGPLAKSDVVRDGNFYPAYAANVAWAAWKAASDANEKRIHSLELDVRQLHATYDGANEFIGEQAATIRRQAAAPASFIWHKISAAPIDSRIVLLFCLADEYPVWPGYFDGDEWLHVDGWSVAPTHWAEMPQAPDVALISEGKTDGPLIDEATRDPDWSAA